MITKEPLSRFALQLVIGFVLVFPVHDLLNQFEIATHVPVEGLARGFLIAILCVFMPALFLRYYEIRRRA